MTPSIFSGMMAGNDFSSVVGMYPVNTVLCWSHRLVWCLALHLKQPRLLHSLSLSLWPGRPQLKHIFHEKFPAFCRHVESIAFFSPCNGLFHRKCSWVSLSLSLSLSLSVRHPTPFVNTNFFPFGLSCHLAFLVSAHFYFVLTTSVGPWVNLPSPQSSQSSSVLTKSGLTWGRLFNVVKTNPFNKWLSSRVCKASKLLLSWSYNVCTHFLVSPMLSYIPLNWI